MARNGRVQVLELDPLNDSRTSLPSLLYISREGEHIVGRGAANAYIERNIDREVILKRVDLGVSIEAYVPSEPDKSESYRPREDNADVREGVRARAMVEVNAPGRLFQSVKSSLRYREFKGTDVFEKHFQVEELAAMILGPIKEAADRAAGHPVEKAVFGRPVHFSHEPDEDSLAERRLRTAAALAGFTDVVFFYEPVAACVEYATAIEGTQRLMVVDIGGGTCDVCIMEFGGAGSAADRLSQSRILSVAGVPVAGDVIDRDVIRAKLFPCLGSKSRYGPSHLPMPQYVYNAIADWQNLYKLNTQEITNWLIAVEASSDQPEAIRALRYLIQRNYGYPLVRKVETAKKLLSSEWDVPIEIHKEAIQISVRMGRSEFTQIIEPTLHDMMQSVLEAERLAGLVPADINHVLTTGGTTLIPAVQRMLSTRYGADRLMARETFTSVASGLAIVSQFV